MHLAAYDRARQRRLQVALDRPLQRACTVDRIVATLCQKSPGCRCQLQLDATLTEPPHQPLQLNVDYRNELLLAQ